MRRAIHLWGDLFHPLTERGAAWDLTLIESHALVELRPNHWDARMNESHALPPGDRPPPREFYHGTSVEAAMNIQDTGFNVDLSGSNAGVSEHAR